MEKAEEASPGAAPKAAATTLLAATRACSAKRSTGPLSYRQGDGSRGLFQRDEPRSSRPLRLRPGHGVAGGEPRIHLESRRRGPKQSRPPFWQLGSIVYWTGIIGLLIGIALEILGFTMRVQISGWAPRHQHVRDRDLGLAGGGGLGGHLRDSLPENASPRWPSAGVALLGTLLAANVPLLDPGIHSLQPVSRSNYWLTIHVLTEVSSYAAFALAMGLGMIATFYYLTATYRRSPAFLEVGAPLIPGVPLLLLGAFGLSASYGGFDQPAARPGEPFVQRVGGAGGPPGGLDVHHRGRRRLR